MESFVRTRNAEIPTNIYLFSLGSAAETGSIPGLQATEPFSLTVFSHRLPRGNIAGEQVMSNQNVFSALIVTWVAVPSLAVFLDAGSARAQNDLFNYTFLVASGFLCDPGDSATCPTVV